MGWHQPPLPFSLMIPYPNDTKGCRNDYIKAFGAVYWA